jgi:hypothetical protein
VRAMTFEGRPADRSRPARPSLRISRLEVQNALGSFTFEVWNPFTASYHSVASMEVGLRRSDYLAGLIGQMWRQQHPRRHALLDPPVPDGIKRAPWAELRINPAAFRSYEFRYSDRPAWVRADGKDHAAEAICERVGYVWPMPA